MITCDKQFLVARCLERGYSLNEVMPCVVSQDGDLWVIDPAHPSYPAVSRKIAPKAPSLPPPGPGDALKKLLARMGIKATPNCSCNGRALLMDMHGCQWCKDNVNTISGWLKEEADKRGLPYIEAAGRTLVRLAIRQACARSQGART